MGELARRHPLGGPEYGVRYANSSESRPDGPSRSSTSAVVALERSHTSKRTLSSLGSSSRFGVDRSTAISHHLHDTTRSHYLEALMMQLSNDVIAGGDPDDFLTVRHLRVAGSNQRDRPGAGVCCSGGARRGGGPTSGCQPSSPAGPPPVVRPASPDPGGARPWNGRGVRGGLRERRAGTSCGLRPTTPPPAARSPSTPVRARRTGMGSSPGTSTSRPSPMTRSSANRRNQATRALAADPWVVELHPDGGYASVSVGIMDVVGAMDGINEAGLAVALLADNGSPTPSPRAARRSAWRSSRSSATCSTRAPPSTRRRKRCCSPKQYYFFVSVSLRRRRSERPVLRVGALGHPQPRSDRRGGPVRGGPDGVHQPPPPPPCRPDGPARRGRVAGHGRHDLLALGRPARGHERRRGGRPRRDPRPPPDGPVRSPGRRGPHVLAGPLRRGGPLGRGELLPTGRRRRASTPTRSGWPCRERIG